jgi:hypothetical protein
MYAVKVAVDIDNIPNDDDLLTYKITVSEAHIIRHPAQDDLVDLLVSFKELFKPYLIDDHPTIIGAVSNPLGWEHLNYAITL